MIFIFILCFLLLLISGMPVTFVLGVSSLIYFILVGVPFEVLAQCMALTFDSFVMLAIPLFMLAGMLMNTGGITNRLFGFANICVKHISGGLGQVNVVASMIFAGMSGSATADAAGLGQVEIQAMHDPSQEDPRESEAAMNDLSYVSLDGKDGDKQKYVLELVGDRCNHT